MKDELLARLSGFGQRHLLSFWEELDDAQRERLARQIRDVDVDFVARLFRGDEAAHDWPKLAARADPPPAFRLDANDNPFGAEQGRRRGQDALRDGRVGAILVAGGQGTRLGFPHPKGMFSLGPVSGRTLFQMHVEQLRAIAGRYGVSIPLYLMTSPATHEETVAFFQEHDRFGLPAEDLRVFCQGTMPAVDLNDGKLLLAERDSLALSPDGHGGTLAALVKNGCLDDAKRRGIEQLFYFQVDNPLCRICDPELIGYHLLSQSEMSTQVVAKTDPLDKVGNLAVIDGKVQIIEYSDLPEQVARRRNDDGSLRLWAGNVAVHVLDVAFLDRVTHQADALPFHCARKKVPHINAEGQAIEPQAENAVKFERFIFDLLPHAHNAIVVEVDEAQTFAPVKNASGQKKDTAETAQAAMVKLHNGWLRAAGAAPNDSIAVEINPLFALDAEELKEKIEPGLVVREATYFV